jgi:hypothetical protein
VFLIEHVSYNSKRNAPCTTQLLCTDHNIERVNIGPQKVLFCWIYKFCSTNGVPTPCTLESTSTKRRTTKYSAPHVCNSHNDIVETCLNMNNSIILIFYHHPLLTFRIYFLVQDLSYLTSKN